MKRYRVRPRNGASWEFDAPYLSILRIRRVFGPEVTMAWIPKQKQHMVRRGKRLVAVIIELEGR